MEAATVVSLGQVIVDMTMRVDAVPHPGEDVFASSSAIQVGASYNLMHAVRQMGVAASHGGIVGRGPWSEMIGRALAADGIDHVGARHEDEDCGYCIALTDDQAERTFISFRGAEAHGDVHSFDGIAPRDSDVVYISGYTLVHDTAKGLGVFLERTADHRFRAVFDPSPVFTQADDAMIGLLIRYRPVWSCNEREAGLIRYRLAGGKSGETAKSGMSGAASARDDCRTLARILESPVVVRTGAEGAWVCEDTHGEPILVEGFPVKAVDTNGAGDCHTGVLCACLAIGVPLPEAVRIANAAASVAVTRSGPATCPSLAELGRLFPALQ